MEQTALMLLLSMVIILFQKLVQTVQMVMEALAVAAVLVDKEIMIVMVFGQLYGMLTQVVMEVLAAAVAVAVANAEQKDMVVAHHLVYTCIIQH
jgi:hypothetical protein